VNADSTAALEWCATCKCWTIAGTRCPKSVACPHCRVAAGRSCRRPSGHRADTLHAERYELAEAIDAAAGITYGAGSAVRP
jgi:hypothetical protein